MASEPQTPQGWFGWTPAATWVFQANPDRYRIDRALDAIEAGELPSIWWRAPAKDGNVAIGERVVIWRDAGEGKDSPKAIPGVVGVGRVIDRAKQLPPDREREFVVNEGDFEYNELRVEIELVPLTGEDGNRKTPLIDKEEWKALLREDTKIISGGNFITFTDLAPPAWSKLCEARPVLARLAGMKGRPPETFAFKPSQPELIPLEGDETNDLEPSHFEYPPHSRDIS